MGMEILYEDESQLCYEVGDKAFRQMACHEAGHAVVSRLVGVGIAGLAAIQLQVDDRILH